MCQDVDLLDIRLKSSVVTIMFCTFSFNLKGKTIRGPGEMATFFQLPGVTAWRRWQRNLTAEAELE